MPNKERKNVNQCRTQKGLTVYVCLKENEEDLMSAVTRIGRKMKHDVAHIHEPFPLNDIQQAYWVGRTKSML